MTEKPLYQEAISFNELIAKTRELIGTLNKETEIEKQHQKWNEFLDLISIHFTDRIKREAVLDGINNRKEIEKNLQNTISHLRNSIENTAIKNRKLSLKDLSPKSQMLIKYCKKHLLESENDLCVPENVIQKALKINNEAWEEWELMSGFLSNHCPLNLNQYKTSEVKNLLEQPWISNINTITLTLQKGFSEPLETIAQSQQLTQLKSLLLNNNQITDKEIQILARSIHLSHLMELSLMGNLIGNKGIKTLLEFNSLSELEYLQLNHNQIGDLGIKTMAETESLKKLKVLDLSLNQITDEGVRVFLRAGHFKNLQILNLSGNQIGDQGASEFIYAEILQNLLPFGLNLTQNPIGNQVKKLLRKKFKYQVILD